MGHEELWAVKQERDRIYALPEMSEDDGIKVAELEVQFAEMDGYCCRKSCRAKYSAGPALRKNYTTAL